jgi:hypothetical protein
MRGIARVNVEEGRFSIALGNRIVGNSINRSAPIVSPFENAPQQLEPSRHGLFQIPLAALLLFR